MTPPAAAGTAPTIAAPASVGMGDRAASDASLETAILALLDIRPEIYPAHLVIALRRRDPGLAIERMRLVLDRLLAERRVARLWHRYLLPRDIAKVRAIWLAGIARHQTALRDGADPDGAQRLILSWDGWNIDTRCELAA